MTSVCNRTAASTARPCDRATWPTGREGLQLFEACSNHQWNLI